MHTGPMMTIPTYTRALVAALTLTLAGCAAPPMALDAPASAAVAPTTSVAEADAKLADVAQRRQAAEALYAAGERECYTRFLVSRCLDKAREQRRATLAGLRAIEVEASHFKRLESIERRDAALAERQKQDAQDAAVRAALPLKKPHVVPEAPAPKARAESIEKRVAEREAKEQGRKAQEAAGAGERAAHAAAFKRKQQEAAARQRAVAEKQAAKADKAAKDAQAAKDASAPEAAGK
jgi:colicin import membrane protein